MKLEDILCPRGKPVLSIGFTGTRMGMTDFQRFTCEQVVRVWCSVLEGQGWPISVFHFGAAEGADQEAYTRFRGVNNLRVINHPASGNIRPTKCWSTVPPKPPLDRNKDIVSQSHLLVATPLTDEQFTRSGTWATVRYAVSCGKPVLLLKIGGGYNYLPGAPLVNSLF